MRKLNLWVLGYIWIFIACTSEPTQIVPPNRTATPDIGAQKLVQSLLDDNAGCRLPCWWGITPGKTTWEEARPILERTSLHIGGQDTADVFSVGVQAYLPYPHDFAKYMEHTYSVRNGVVDYIRVYNFDLAPSYSLPNLLESYGRPTEVWVRTVPKAERGIQHFLIDVFYQELGLLIVYGTGDPMQEVDGRIKNCMVKEMDSPFIHIWSVEKYKLSFQEAKKFIDTTGLPEPMPLPYSTGMDIKSFYNTFKNPETDVCLETPKILWQ